MPTAAFTFAIASAIASATSSATGGRLTRAWARLLLAAWAFVVPAVHAAGPVVVTDQVRAELLVHAPQGLRPGQAAWLGLKIEHRPGWHTYWLNPGDSGLPTSLQWTLPASLEAGEIQWPVPRRLPIGPLMNHGYEDVLVLPVPLKVLRDPGAMPLTLRLRGDWLVCKDVCIPEGGDFVLTLPAGAAQSALAASGALFEKAFQALPKNLEGASAAATAGPDGLDLKLTGLPAAWHGRALAVFPETPHVLAPAIEPVARWEGAASATQAGTWAGRLALSPQRMESPADMRFVVALASGPNPAGVQVAARIEGRWPELPGPGSAAATAPPLPVSPGATLPASASGTPDTTTTGAWDAGGWTALVFALIGGAILNLMPCVFPVLSLKVFGFAQHAQDRRALLVGGLAYTVGVVLSFLVLAGVLLALRSAGEQIGWGFQLQSPAFVAALALLFTLIGLNLLGLFEINVFVPTSAAGLQARHPVVDQMLTGVLAVVVASPCTAPFMGASLGAAVTLPTPQALAIFAALGLGMALPYLALCGLPGLAQRLPRPGVWMLHFKHAMALPMLGTVVWLLWVLGHQAGIDAVVGLLGVLLVLAFGIGAWSLARPGSTARWVTRLGAVAALAATVAWAWPSIHAAVDARSASWEAGATGESTNAGTSAAAPGTWGAWSPARVADLNAQGKTVFVDFTAAWCVTCQVNKRSTLADAQVLQALADRGVVLMRADWTRRDETITRELTRLRRTGVPVYAFYTGAAEPLLLPEVLTPGLMLQALQGLPAAR